MVKRTIKFAQLDDYQKVLETLGEETLFSSQNAEYVLVISRKVNEINAGLLSKFNRYTGNKTHLD